MNQALLEEPKVDAPPPLRSVHSSNFPALLDALGASLLVTTYQAGKLVVVRADGDRLNTHFRSFKSPMGLALAGGRLAIGTGMQVWEFHDVPAVAAKLPGDRRHDACFLPRATHYTGNIQVHEMAWSGTDLWLVNTRFSCLCILDRDHSFVPRWRPPFISALAPQDRCHLNGLAMQGGAPRYVTALGSTDVAAGWRQDKARGGVLMEVPSGEIVVRGLSMPHSPRLRQRRLWACEGQAPGPSGSSTRPRSRYEPVASFPGFTRGLAFAGRYAFVGLSQVRESAVFSGIPLTERLAERSCGVWVLDIVTGKIAAFLRFEDAVQEVFAVEVVVGRRCPDLLNDDKLLADSFVLPTEALADVPAPIGGKPRPLAESRV